MNKNKIDYTVNHCTLPKEQYAIMVREKEEWYEAYELIQKCLGTKTREEELKKIRIMLKNTAITNKKRSNRMAIKLKYYKFSMLGIEPDDNIVELKTGTG